MLSLPFLGSVQINTEESPLQVIWRVSVIEPPSTIPETTTRADNVELPERVTQAFHSVVLFWSAPSRVSRFCLEIVEQFGCELTTECRERFALMSKAKAASAEAVFGSVAHRALLHLM
eukprot:712378-Amphidinium_carterae.1